MGTYLLLDETQAVFDTREAGGEKTATCNLYGETIILSFDEETGTYYNSDVGLTGLSENGDWYIALDLGVGLPGKAVVTNQTETVYDPDNEYEFTGTVINIVTRPIVSFECELGTFTYDREGAYQGQPYYVYKNGTKELVLENRLPNNKSMVAFDPDPNGDGWWGDDYAEYSITSYELTENEMFAGWGDYNSEDNLYYLYTGSSASEAYNANASCIFLVPKITVATSPWVVSVKPGVAYVKENKRVYYNKEKGIFSKFIYTVTSTTNPTFIVASLQDISYIIIDGRKVSRGELTGNERGYGIGCGYYYQFDTDGMHSVEIKFKRGDLRSSYLFGEYSNDFCFDHAPVVSAQLGEGITTIPYGCFAQVDELTGITLPSTLEVIGPYAFAYTDGLNSITIPDSVKRIEDGAFAYNWNSSRFMDFQGGNGVEYLGYNAFSNTYFDKTALTSYGNILYLGKCAYKAFEELPEGETGYTLKNDTTCIYTDCFSGHTDITSITIPNTVKSIGLSAFQGCTNLSDIAVPDSVEGILGYGSTYDDKGVFSHCSSLTSVTLGTGITSLCSYCFCGCSNLKSITIPANVVSLGTSLFKDCTQLENVSLGSNTESIPGECFRNCTSLSSVTIPNTVKSIEWACFAGAALNNITMPSSVESVNYEVFSGCTGLTRVVMPDTITSINLDGMFNGCINLVEVTLPLNAAGRDKPNISTNSAFTMCSKLTGVTLPHAVSGIGRYCFMGCTSLPSDITFPANIKCLGNYSFSGCSQIASMTFETNEIINSSYLQISMYAISGCTSLANFYGPCASQDNKLLLSGSTAILAVLSGFPASYTIPSNVQVLWSDLFNRNTRITNITIPSSVTRIDTYCFYGATNLTSVTFNEGLKEIGTNAFNNTRMSTLSIPNSVEKIGDSAFCNNYNLSLVNIGTGLTSLPNGCFMNSFNLQFATVNIPGNIKSIGTLCFGYNTTSNQQLRTVNIENGLETIGASAFCSCISIEQLTLPASLKSISNGCFSGCTSLATIRCEATTAPTVYSNTFRYIKTGGTLYYPAGSDYSSWMSNSNYYLGSRSWTSQTFTP